MSNPVILVPLDGSEAPLAALPVAKVLGQVAPAALRLLHVAEREPADAELLSRLRLQARAIDNATVDVRTGEPATEILRYAEEMKPLGIILCKHSAPAPREMLGSTAASVLRGTSDPLVLVAPERGTAPWRLQFSFRMTEHPAPALGWDPRWRSPNMPVPSCSLSTWRT
jgi:nucleotide-binding universal stress UspA family protein